jgi:glutamate synthase (NADPH/NADH) small chain
MAEFQIPVQPEKRRSRNFNEVVLGYNRKIALEEARRCPQCTSATCANECPLGVDIPGFIRFVREGQVQSAYNLIMEANALPGICGRICSAPCEKVCIESNRINVRALERFAADSYRAPDP